MKKVILALAILMFFGVNLACAEISLKAEVDKLALSTDQALTYKLTINSTEKQLPQPQFPKLESFSVVSQTQSSNISFEKDGIKTAVVYAFTLVPLKAGKFKIPSSQLKINGKVYQSESFDIEVTQGKANLKPPQEQAPEETPPESEEPQYTL